MLRPVLRRAFGAPRRSQDDVLFEVPQSFDWNVEDLTKLYIGRVLANIGRDKHGHDGNPVGDMPKVDEIRVGNDIIH